MSAKTFFAGVAALAAFGTPVGAFAAPVITAVNGDLLISPITFSFMGGSFTFSGMNTFPDYLNVMTGSTAAMPASVAAVRTVAGSPSTDFINRSTVVYDASTLGGFGSFPNPTTVPFTNGDNFLGLRVTVADRNYYGFAYTTNTVLNSYGFETAPNVGITATAAVPAAVPEAATWSMMILGFGAIGTVLRRRQRGRMAFT